MSGSIVALSPARDKFSTRCVVAVVAARPLQGVQSTPCEIDIFFARTEDIEIDPQLEWLMIEARTGYYEAWRHTMKAFQKLATEKFPLSEQVCSLLPDIAPPSYLINKSASDISAAVQDPIQKVLFEKVDIINKWPPLPHTSLDVTQWESLRQMLTKRLAIIQGPPGTGKTYVSKVALQILLQNRSPDDPPIIVAAQTNHALDQLLEHVSIFEPEYIRLGGRSTNPGVKKRALFTIRREERLPLIAGGLLGPSNAALRNLFPRIMKIVEPLQRHYNQPFAAETFLHWGIISKQQFDSLEVAAAQWVSADEGPESSIQVWLNNNLVPFKVAYQTENFGFEEEDEDLEFEQLQELEAETGVNDEEDIEMLQGPWCQLSDPWTTQSVAAATLDKAKRELDTKNNLNDIPAYLRPVVYSIMQEKVKIAMRVKVQELAEEYEKTLKNLRIGKWERDAIFLRKANVIGMTTTGLSKYRPLIASLKPKIVLIEEAAEVIEAPVAAACIESLEHLILVGDHQQLQGHCSVQELGEEPYYLNVSMFERLVGNGMPFKTLLRQRRMNPEFRQLLMPLYPKLEDHEDVLRRTPRDFGMGAQASFFFDHDFIEDRDSQSSSFNDQEAEFVTGFYKFLLQNGVLPQEITILTFYNGQRKRILKYLRSDPFTKEHYNNVKTVDSYQGEENEIVLLSLVRNNDSGKIGFLDNDNRVCVALSRAKRGFYMFGNAGLLASESQLWKQVINVMERSPSRIGSQFPLQCKNHGARAYITWPQEWKDNDGGCDQLCGWLMSCGHKCTLRCHPYAHETLKCLRDCLRKLPCGHACQNKCFQPCECPCRMQASPGEDSNPHNSDGTAGSGYGRWPTLSHGQSYSGNVSNSPPSTKAVEVRGNNNFSSKRLQWKHSHRHEDQCLEHIPSGVPVRASLASGSTFKPLTSREFSPAKRPSGSRPSSSSAGSRRSKFLPESLNKSMRYRTHTNDSQFAFDLQELNTKDWNSFAKGGVKLDDLKKEGVVNEKDTDKFLRPLIEFDGVEDTAPVKSQIVTDMSDGRKRWVEEFQVPGTRKRGDGELQVSDGASSSRRSQVKHVECENLIDMD